MSKYKSIYVDIKTSYVDINTLYVDIRTLYVDIHTLYAVGIPTLYIFRYTTSKYTTSTSSYALSLGIIF
jgi:hypothetical protein